MGIAREHFHQGNLLEFELQVQTGEDRCSYKNQHTSFQNNEHFYDIWMISICYHHLTFDLKMQTHNSDLIEFPLAVPSYSSLVQGLLITFPQISLYPGRAHTQHSIKTLSMAQACLLFLDPIHNADPTDGASMYPIYVLCRTSTVWVFRDFAAPLLFHCRTSVWSPAPSDRGRHEALVFLHILNWQILHVCEGFLK
jgi:hypothetical protein